MEVIMKIIILKLSLMKRIRWDYDKKSDYIFIIIFRIIC